MTEAVLRLGSQGLSGFKWIWDKHGVWLTLALLIILTAALPPRPTG